MPEYHTVSAVTLHPIPNDVNREDEEVEISDCESLASKNRGKGSDSDSINDDNDGIAEILGDEPPDGGRKAWLVVLASFLIHFVTFGITYSFGVFQLYYESTEFANGRATKAEIAFIGTVGFACIFCVGIFSGKLAEVFGYRKTVMVGSGMIVAGLVLSAFATELWQLILTQGLLFGLGSSLVYFPGVSVPAQWWKKRRSFATGIAVAGSGLGSLVVTPLSDVLLRQVGRKSTLLITAGMAAGLLSVAIACLHTRVLAGSAAPEPKTLRGVMRKLVDLSQFRNPQFVPLLAGIFMNPFGYLVPFYFLPSYVKYIGLDASWGPNLLNIINATSIVGRVLFGLVADRVGNINALLVTIAFETISCVGIWMWASTPATLIVFCIVFGLFGGGFVSLMPSVSAQVCGVHNLAATIGLVYSALSVGHLAGPPLAATLINTAIAPGTAGIPSGGYAGMIVLAGGATAVGFVAIAWLRWGVVGGRWNARV